MKLKEILSKRPKSNIDRTVFSLLSTLIVILALIVIAGIFFPAPVSIILNTLWVILLIIVAVFFGLGILVIIGMRKEVSKFLDILLEGGLTFMEFLQFLKDLWKKFILMLQDFLVFAAPLFAYIAALVVYVVIIIVYKFVGKDYDVTILTIGLTIFLIGGFGLINKPKKIYEEVTNWISDFKKRFKGGFVDGLEIVLFLFFLTMDNPNIFFLPEELRVPLRAHFGDYDLMTRSFVYSDHLKVTVNIILITVIIEIIRNLIKVYAVARRYHLEKTRDATPTDQRTLMEDIKWSLRKSFSDTKDDLMKFITFTTVLFLVFLLFPRLKLLTLVVASVTNLILDLVFRARLTATKGTDLITRTLAKVFKF